jgi:hypothetical protein
MGKYTATAQSIVEKKMAKLTRVEAFRKVRTDNFREITAWSDHIDRTLERFENDPPVEYRENLVKFEIRIAEERQFLRDLDELEESTWANGA